ncbi:MAG TPA: YggT family protein [Pseudoclavibacter sp.]|nr:YggT family protein [Pseudoclavibacter sp.]
MIAIIAGVLYAVVYLYLMVIWARFVIDLVLALNPRLRPARGWIVLFEVVYTLTDPPISFFRKLIPPMRMGAFSLDFGLLLTLLSCSLILNVLSALR